MKWVMQLAIIAFCHSASAFTAPSVNIEVRVVDESGSPVPEAIVQGVFYGAGKYDTDKQITDKKGLAIISGRSVYPVPVAVSKLGYYAGGKKVSTREISAGEEYYGDRKAVLVLREKRNPIPLYARKYKGEIPVSKEWVGFDFEKADWVAPYGQGNFADVEFYYEGYVQSFWDAKGKLRMRFSGRDGVIDVSDRVSSQSKLLLPYVAPFEGYVGEELWWNIAMSDEVDQEHKPSHNKHYFFRLRSVLDEEENIVQANYAKIQGDIHFFFKTTSGGAAGVTFQYYFNPVPNVRNLEFDIKKNLFYQLTHDEVVWEP